MDGDFYVSTDKSRLDIPLIHRFLSKESYWAKGRNLETVKTSVENSECFGVYTGDRQVGFARVVTDYAVIGWIMDVFILKEFRGRGLGKQLMNSLLNHDKLRHLRSFRLGTEDAPGLYAQFGFTPLKKPGNMMERISKSPQK